MYVIYHKETTVLHQSKTRKQDWATRAAAEGEFTRAGLNKDTFAIATWLTFSKHIEKKRIVYSIFDTDKERPIEITVNTPAYLDPSTETYHSI